MSTAAPAGANATADDNDDERHDEGRSSDVEGPAGHGGTRDGGGVNVVQLSEVLELG